MNIMKFLLKLFRKLFPSFASIVKSSLVGFSTGLMIYINCYQRHFISKRYIGYSFIIAVAATLITAYLRECYLVHKLKSLKMNIRVFIFLFSFLFAVIIFVNFHTQYQPLYFSLPDTHLQIRIPANGVQEGQEPIRLLRIDTGQGFVHYTDMDFEGDWKREDKNLVFLPGQEVIINWVGKAGSLSEVVFRKTAYDQPVFISWNGVETEYNLNSSEASNVVFQDQLDEKLEPDYVIQDKHTIPLQYLLPGIVFSVISFGFCFLILLTVLGTWQPFRAKKKKHHKYAWLAYMLPMLLVWGFSLLVFWPGIMSNDSLTSWSQAISGQFNDWQSAFYSLVLSWLTKIWFSPAIISIFQIFVLSFLVARGLKTLQEHGVPSIILSAISILFAIFPINNLYIITIWRDILYTIAFLWFTLLIIKTYLSNGEWLRNKGWLWLALSGLMIAILRQNGIPVVILALIVLIFVYFKYKKQIITSLVVLVCLLLLIKGPVYSGINIDRSKSGQENLILLHHIAAHIDAGTELKAEEEEYLNSLLPISDWFYYSCYVGTISYDAQFEREEFLSNDTQNRKIAFDLFLREPLVDIYHTFDSAELVWRFLNNQCIMKSLHGFSSWKPGEVRWINWNDLGVEQDSKIPSIVQPYVDFLRVFGIRDDFLVPYLRPALYLYLSIFSSVVLMIRRQDLKALLLCMPIVFQSIILYLISFAPAVRYQYSNYLIGILLLAILFLPKKEIPNSDLQKS